MSSLIPARWRRGNSHETPAEAAVSPEHAPGDQPGRLEAPRGRIAWVCATPAGRCGCEHDNEQQAKWHGKTVWWPVVVDETQESA